MEKSLHLPDQGRKCTHDTPRVQWVQGAQALSQNAEEHLIAGNQRSSRLFKLPFPLCTREKKVPINQKVNHNFTGKGFDDNLWK